MSFYINLDSREDRREQFEEECKKMKINVERFSAIKNEKVTAGPAISAATIPVNEKRPAPIMAPIPSVIKLKEFRVFLSPCSESPAAAIN